MSDITNSVPEIPATIEPVKEPEKAKAPTKAPRKAPAKKAEAKPGMEPKKGFKKGQKRKAELAKMDAAKATGKTEKTERKMLQRHQELWDAADKGKLPDMKQVTLDFLGEDGKGGKGAKPTHKSWVKRFRTIADLIKAKDLKGLKADSLKPESSSRVIICRYRDLAIRALEMKAKGEKAKAKAEPKVEPKVETELNPTS